MDKKNLLKRMTKMTPEEQEQRAKEMEALGEMKLRRKEIGELTQKLEQKQDDISLILEALNKLVLADQKKALRRFRKTREELQKKLDKPTGSGSKHLGQPNVW